ncbi:MAG: hypothetical protein ABEJ89_03345 [Haloarculaceae archaeon]
MAPVDADASRVDDAPGERSVTLGMDHCEAVEHVRAVFTAAGFDALAAFSPVAGAASERDEQESAGEYYTVLGLGVSDRCGAAGEDDRLGALYPLRVAVREVEPGRQRVTTVDAVRAARGTGRPTHGRLGTLAAEAGRMVDAAYADLGRTRAGPRTVQG